VGKNSGKLGYCIQGNIAQPFSGNDCLWKTRSESTIFHIFRVLFKKPILYSYGNENLIHIFRSLIYFCHVWKVFLACHILRIFISLHEMVVIRHAMDCARAGMRSFPMWAIVTTYFRWERWFNFYHIYIYLHKRKHYCKSENFSPTQIIKIVRGHIKIITLKCDGQKKCHKHCAVLQLYKKYFRLGITAKVHHKNQKLTWNISP